MERNSSKNYENKIDEDYNDLLDDEFDFDSVTHLLDGDVTSDFPNGSQIPCTLSNAGGLCTEKEYEGFDISAGQTWIYPTNYPVRDYQYNIAEAALTKNTLVSLPTGLGKTFIASVVMYNFYRWYPRGKVVFMAPTKPLVNQQIHACQKVVAIPIEDTIEITGKMANTARKVAWDNKRVFFITPQVLQNDLAAGIFPVQSLRLLVVDEAHHTRGKYSYGEVVRMILEQHNTFRVLALSATPGKTPADVIEVARALNTSHLEIRGEDSVDVKPYTHQKNIHTMVVRLDQSLKETREKYIAILDVYVRRLLDAQVLSGSTGTLGRGRIIMEYKNYKTMSEQGKKHPNHSQIMSDFSMCVSLYHGLDLLLSHGYRVFMNFFDGDDSKSYLLRDRQLMTLLDDIRKKIGQNPLEINNDSLPDGTVPQVIGTLDYGHPKFIQLRNILLGHFTYTNEKNESSSTSVNNASSRVIVFCEFRESVHLVYRLLLQCGDPLRPQVFVGQGGTTKKVKAVGQKQQMLIMDKFRSGECNVLIATCIAEEGLDVGEVDLIVCFDTSTQNPVRLVQRLGRTGRQRAGRVVLLVTEGREEMTLQKCMSEKNSLVKRLMSSVPLRQALAQINGSGRMIPSGVEPRCVRMYLTTTMTNSAATENMSESTNNQDKTSKKGKTVTRKGKTKDKTQPDLPTMFSRMPSKSKLDIQPGASRSSEPSPTKKPQVFSPKSKKSNNKKASSNKIGKGDMRYFLKKLDTVDIMSQESRDVFENIPKKSDKLNEPLCLSPVSNELVSEPNTNQLDYSYMVSQMLDSPSDILPSSLVELFVELNTNNITATLNNECKFCDKIIECRTIVQIPENTNRLDFLKGEFVEPDVSWIKTVNKSDLKISANSNISQTKSVPEDFYNYVYTNVEMDIFEKNCNISVVKSSTIIPHEARLSLFVNSSDNSAVLCSNFKCEADDIIETSHFNNEYHNDVFTNDNNVGNETDEHFRIDEDYSLQEVLGYFHLTSIDDMFKSPDRSISSKQNFTSNTHHEHLPVTPKKHHTKSIVKNNSVNVCPSLENTLLKSPSIITKCKQSPILNLRFDRERNRLARKRNLLAESQVVSSTPIIDPTSVCVTNCDNLDKGTRKLDFFNEITFFEESDINVNIELSNTKVDNSLHTVSENKKSKANATEPSMLTVTQIVSLIGKENQTTRNLPKVAPISEPNTSSTKHNYNGSTSFMCKPEPYFEEFERKSDDDIFAEYDSNYENKNQSGSCTDMENSPNMTQEYKLEDFNCSAVDDVVLGESFINLTSPKSRPNLSKLKGLQIITAKSSTKIETVSTNKKIECSFFSDRHNKSLNVEKSDQLKDMAYLSGLLDDSGFNIGDDTNNIVANCDKVVVESKSNNSTLIFEARAEENDATLKNKFGNADSNFDNNINNVVTRNVITPPNTSHYENSDAETSPILKCVTPSQMERNILRLRQFHRSPTVSTIKPHNVTNVKLNNSADESLLLCKRKRKKRPRILDSDEEEFAKSQSWVKPKAKFMPLKNKHSSGHQFLDLEAGVSGDDEDDHEDDNDAEDLNGFIDDSMDHPPDKSDMTAQYLQSIRSPLKHGAFKIPNRPAMSKVDLLNIFSQPVPEQDQTYGNDSFVDDEPTIYSKELCELEKAERILKDRRKQKKMQLKRKRSPSGSHDENSLKTNNTVKRRKITKHEDCSSDEDFV